MSASANMVMAISSASVAGSFTRSTEEKPDRARWFCRTRADSVDISTSDDLTSPVFSCASGRRVDLRTLLCGGFFLAEEQEHELNPQNMQLFTVSRATLYSTRLYIAYHIERPMSSDDSHDLIDGGLEHVRQLLVREHA